MFKTLKLELVPEVSVLPQHLQRPARVEIVAAKEETSNEAKEEPEDEVLVEDDDENGEKSETESFGFEVPDEAILDAPSRVNLGYVLIGILVVNLGVNYIIFMLHLLYQICKKLTILYK